LKLHEYQAKRLLADQGIPVPPGRVADTPGEARRIAEDLGFPVAVKAQVLVGGRGKAGGIRLARSGREAESVAAGILRMCVSGIPVRSVLVETAASIRREIYLGLTVDRTSGCALYMASSRGGVDIEEVARTHPEAVCSTLIDPCVGLRPYHSLILARAAGLDRGQSNPFGEIARGLYSAFCANDAWLAEINPLAATESGGLVALDAKMVVDDNALYRHPELERLRNADEESPAEREARESGISYVQLEGDIGCLVNGAGLAMATMDAVKLSGGAPANFLDIGGGARADAVSEALRIMLSGSSIKVILVNIFGGITRCDEVATGLVQALASTGRAVTVVARLVGTNEAEGRSALAASDLPIVEAPDLAGAARLAVAIAREQAAAGGDSVASG
jgi:succinyl-CoA synthetase beta subunit